MSTLRVIVSIPAERSVGTEKIIYIELWILKVILYKPSSFNN